MQACGCGLSRGSTLQSRPFPQMAGDGGVKFQENFIQFQVADCVRVLLELHHA